MMIASFLLPHFWADAVTTLAYLFNIQPSATLQGGIPLERLSGPILQTTRCFTCLVVFAMFSFPLANAPN
jgi:hypothetical protein